MPILASNQCEKTVLYRKGLALNKNFKEFGKDKI
jgi:hypothetical protein